MFTINMVAFLLFVNTNGIPVMLAVF